MEQKFLIMGYREKVDFPSFCDGEAYSLKEAIDKSKEYLRKIRTLSKIILFEQEEADAKRDANITLMSRLVRSKGYFREIGALSMIILFEQEKANAKRDPNIPLMK